MKHLSSSSLQDTACLLTLRPAARLSVIQRPPANGLCQLTNQGAHQARQQGSQRSSLLANQPNQLGERPHN
ncbi:hypothetical protein NQZ68_023170 [Dissostichus eleginoides]|nr:hypothetical protein NQZ68_023170 [Dissostichus eleginoides]